MMRSEGASLSISRKPDLSGTSVLVIDDEACIVRALRSLLEGSFGKVMTTTSPLKAIGILRRHEVAVVICDQMMPGTNGIDLLALIRKSWPRIVTILLTACADVRLVERALNQGLIEYFLTKPWDSDRLLEIAEKAAQEYLRAGSPQPGIIGQRELEPGNTLNGFGAHAREAAISLCRAVDARNFCTRVHSEKVAFHADLIARRMGLDEEQCQRVRIGGLLHDLGKVGIPDAILSATGALDEPELAILRNHPVIGSSIIAPIGFPDEVMAVVEQHHENFDGSGYPAGLEGEEIGLAARIVHVADAYDAMSTDRTYRKALSAEAIVEEFEKQKGLQFDPEVTGIFLDALGTGQIEAAGGKS